MNIRLDEVYAEHDGATLRFDAFVPASSDPLPAVVCIHGGGWVSGDRCDYHDVAKAFAAQGYAAFCPQYRLAPLYPFPAAVDDIRAFVGFLRKEASSLGIRKDAIGSFGNSAGGHLSLMLAVSPSADERVNAAVDVSGLTDLTHPEENHPPIAWDFINQFMAVPYSGNEAQWIAASPVYHVAPETAPTLIYHGSADDIVWKSQSEKMHDAMLGHGLRSNLVILDGEGHSFSIGGFDTILNGSYDFFAKTLSPVEVTT